MVRDEPSSQTPGGTSSWILVLVCSVFLASPEPHVAPPLFWLVRTCGSDAPAVTDLKALTL